VSGPDPRVDLERLFAENPAEVWRLAQDDPALQAEVLAMLGYADDGSPDPSAEWLRMSSLPLGSRHWVDVALSAHHRRRNKARPKRRRH
jgi:hypothetical protein